MKKILFISDMFPHDRNEIDGIFVQHQVDEIAQSFAVKVIATHFPAHNSISISHSEPYEVIHLDYPQCKLFFPGTTLFFLKYALPKIKRLIADWKPDIIHVHDCRHLPELWSLKGYLDTLQITKYLTIHNIKTLPQRQKLLMRPLYQLTMKKAYQNWTQVFTVNRFLKEAILPFIDASRVTVIGNAILPRIPVLENKLEQFRNLFPIDSYKLIAVGNLVTTKGYDILVRTVDTLIKQGRNISVLIVGSGAERDKLRSLIHSLHREKQIIMQAALPNNIVRNLYSLFDAFVLPSYSESFGIVYLEAMDANIPVIGVRGQGIDGVITHGENGLLVEPQNIEDLCKQICYLMDEPICVSQMVNAAKITVQSHLMPQMIELLSKYYNQ